MPNEEEKGIAGFEGVFSITGLLAIALLIRRRR
jgi:PGF-CTERM protein